MIKNKIIIKVVFFGVVVALCFFVSGLLADSNKNESIVVFLFGIFILSIFIVALIYVIGAVHAIEVKCLKEGLVFLVRGNPTIRRKKCFMVLDYTNLKGNPFFAQCEIGKFPYGAEKVKVESGELVAV